MSNTVIALLSIYAAFGVLWGIFALRYANGKIEVAFTLTEKIVANPVILLGCGIFWPILLTHTFIKSREK